MAQRILFVRAVNVGGASLPMAEFRELLGSLGARNVRTYIASGNAVLDLDGDPDAFDRAVEKGLTERYGYVREVMSRTAEELRAALEAHPFEVVDEKWSYVSFLAGEPTPAAIEAAASVKTGDDLWQVIGRELHLRYANGAGTATLNQEALTRKLGVPATARNLRTVRALLALSG
ncbi:DUF1697 domain-containing protein [Salinibacterium soli]|uniref:DUF1697 domain-containing protein n=1 Tax=Antiquaquibacter soli TaxID=3064523 RepID=A0ABT9BR13_9MICO|nr:DUF1697 domain-containing protein [Protaetiibacter sp. WY-16]MDO7883415.1 DUF1697 domain-containing protein [Protaetiibacter sp. WY-16]